MRHCYLLRFPISLSVSHFTQVLHLPTFVLLAKTHNSGEMSAFAGCYHLQIYMNKGLLVKTLNSGERAVGEEHATAAEKAKLKRDVSELSAKIGQLKMQSLSARCLLQWSPRFFLLVSLGVFIPQIKMNKGLLVKNTQQRKNSKKYLKLQLKFFD